MDGQLRAVFFDFDGTLCDSAATIVRLMKQACRECALDEPDEKVIRGNIGYGVSHAALSYTAGDADKAALLADCYRRLSREEYLSGNPPLDPLFDGVGDMLRALRREQYLSAVITNKGRAGLNSLLGRHGLDRLMDYSVTADDCVVKPAPDMAHLAMRRFGVEPAGCLLVGDTEIDAGCAANAGIGFIGVGWGYHSPQLLREKGALAILDSFDELPGLAADYFMSAT